MTASEPEIRLLGAEMLTWSDLDNTGGFDGVLVAPLVSGFARRPERLLIVGPTTPAVIQALAHEADHVDVLVRSWPDAQKLREVLPDDVVVHCGPLDRMSRISGGHDAVVALAGIDRLHSAEEPMPPWPRVLAGLADLVGPQGELLVGVGNTIGVDALVTLHPTGFHPDESWPQGHLPPSPPPNVEELLARLASEHQLIEVETWWCHGPRLRPGLIASRPVLTDLRSDPLLVRRVTGAYEAQGSSTTDALRDPGQVAAELLEAGLGAATAPLAMLHVRRGERGAVTSGTPSMIAQEDHWVGASPAICRYEHTGATWQRRLAVPAVQEQVAPGLRRDLGRLEGEVPTGRTLADQMRDLLASWCAGCVPGSGRTIPLTWSPSTPPLTSIASPSVIRSGCSMRAMWRPHPLLATLCWLGCCFVLPTTSSSLAPDTPGRQPRPLGSWPRPWRQRPTCVSTTKPLPRRSRSTGS
jgi:hypothetical protein